jgi:hypothetical protein
MVSASEWLSQAGRKEERGRQGVMEKPRQRVLEKLTGKGMAWPGYPPMTRVHRCTRRFRSRGSNNGFAVFADPEVRPVLRQNRGKRYK